MGDRLDAVVGGCLVGPVLKALWYFVPSAAPRTDGIFLMATGRQEELSGPALRPCRFYGLNSCRGLLLSTGEGLLERIEFGVQHSDLVG